MAESYCNNFLQYQRRHTVEVIIGGISLGGNNPIRIQSMTNTSTDDIASTVEQIIRIQQAGADYARLTVPSLKDAENLNQIISELKARKCSIPIIADVHFSPAIARISATMVHKVRINPGNYIDRKHSRIIDYTEENYRKELQDLMMEFVSLLGICKKHGTALRIGTNHGSLSDRIMSRYGDTPEGMAESAMEFLRVCREENFNQVVISMKASNTRTMVYATRLLVKKMNEENMHFPLHLGVTEAGEGEDGRIRSAVGIGALMADGIGDTIRVSLTEDPEAEIPIAKKIAGYFSQRRDHVKIPGSGPFPIDAYAYCKRKTHSVGNIGGSIPPVVIGGIQGIINREQLAVSGWHYSTESGWKFDELSPDILSVDSWPADLPLPGNKYILVPEFQGENLNSRRVIKRIDLEEYKKGTFSSHDVKAVQIFSSMLTEKVIEQISQDESVIIILETDNTNGFADQRAAIFRMINKGCHAPVILKRNYAEAEPVDFQLKSACDLGGLFIDGLAEGIWLENSEPSNGHLLTDTAYSILQFSRVRISKTEYISCPSCGRTLFDLQSTTRKIRERTSHLKGLKIGIMGCIVNGPGEMADADYGYVGAGRGRVTLYKEKEIIKRNVPEEKAVDELIVLIKENGDWIEP
jgi:(E)-4-hydroxy-3-methylbut-2-enyl-diphosphate synthase